VFFRWVEGFKDVSDAAVEARKVSRCCSPLSNPRRKRLEPGSKRSTLKYNGPLLNFAAKLKLRRYVAAAAAVAGTAAGPDEEEDDADMIAEATAVVEQDEAPAEAA
jgi:hypothetical protein